MSLPRVSVVIPNFNHARLLPRCLEALTRQSVPPHEILVIDDGSTDNSLEVLGEWARKSLLVRVHRNERNQGVVPTMNRGLALAEGDWLLFVAADDEVLPNLLADALPLAVQHPQAGLISGLSEWHDEAKGLRWHHGKTMPPQACYLAPDEMVRLARSGRLSMSGQSALYRKAALVDAGGWIPELRWFTDWFGVTVVAFRHGICHVPKVFSIFNLDPASYYNTARSGAERRAVLVRMLNLLEGHAYEDVAPRIRESGMLGSFGLPMLQVALGRRREWRLLNGSFLRKVGRRSAELAGRRFLPPQLARACLRRFYWKS